MIIQKDESIQKWAIEEIQTAWGRNSREGIHLSDLLTPRKKFWQDTEPQPSQFRDICIWMGGNAFEVKFLKALGIQHGEAKEWNGIYYTPDIFFNFPCELKSRRRNLAEEGKEEEDYAWYLQQLKGYCAVEGKKQGWLIVLSFVQNTDTFRTEPEIRFYRVEYTAEELEEEKQRLLTVSGWLKQSLNEGDYRILPDCPEWMCRKKITTITKKPHCLTCKKDFETEWGINRHVESKTGKGHEVTMPEYQTAYEPVCVYYLKCKGFVEEAKQ